MNHTPQQEKAKELVDKYYAIVQMADKYQYLTRVDEREFSKQSAIIAVDEIIKAKPLSFGIEFWEEVKKEITNL